MKRVFFATFTLLFLAAPAFAGKFETLRDNYNRQRSKSFEERKGAISAFGGCPTKQCAAYLGQLYSSERDSKARQEILRALGRVRVAPAGKILTRAATQAATTEERMAAVDGLSRVRPAPKVEVFVAVLVRRDNSPELRQRAVASLQRATSPVAVEGLATVLAERNPSAPGPLLRECERVLRLLVSRNVAAGEWILKTVQDPKKEALLPALLPMVMKTRAPKESVSKAMIVLLEHKDAETRALAAGALGECLAGTKTLDGCEALGKLLEDKSIGVAAMAATAIHSIGAQQQVLPKLLELAGSKDVRLRTVAMAALAGCTDPAVVEAATKGLASKALSVQSAAVEVLAASKDKGAIDVLLTALKKHNKGGRLKLDILTALRRVTGVNAGSDYSDWKTWWGEQRAGFTFKGVKRVVTGSAKPQPLRQVGSKTRKKKKVPTYYGSEVLSHRIAFVCDNSGSMNSGGSIKSTSKLTILKNELMGVIKNLPSRTRFNIYSFGSDWKSWQKKIVPANGRNKKSALAYVQALSGAGQTLLYDPLEAALMDKEVDTIYLLSDGAPSRGKYTATADILRAIARINSTRRVVIHTISIGGMNKMMVEVARANSGQAIAK
jgi:HEAT repeat protein